MPGLSGEGVLLEALNGPSADDKEIIRLAAWEELPRRDMAVILDMTPKTVRPLALWLDSNDRVNVLLAGIALGGVVEVMSTDAATGEPTEPDDIPSFERMVALLRVLPLDGEATSVEIGFRGEDSSMVGFTVGDMGLGVGDAVIELGVE